MTYEEILCHSLKINVLSTLKIIRNNNLGIYSLKHHTESDAAFIIY